MGIASGGTRYRKSGADWNMLHGAKTIKQWNYSINTQNSDFDSTLPNRTDIGRFDIGVPYLHAIIELNAYTVNKTTTNPIH
jgi:hypothetical protein